MGLNNNSEFGIMNSELKVSACGGRLCGRGFASETRSAEAAKHRKCNMTAGTKYGKRHKEGQSGIPKGVCPFGEGQGARSPLQGSAKRVGAAPPLRRRRKKHSRPKPQNVPENASPKVKSAISRIR